MRAHVIYGCLTTVLCCAITGCGPTGSSTPTAPTIYVLSVQSATPSSGVGITASPADTNASTGGTTGLALFYTAGTTVTLTAPSTGGSGTFVSWGGCASASGTTCTLTVNAAVTVTANYNAPTITSVTVTPNQPNQAVIIGTQQQFTATVAGLNAYSPAVTWTLAAPGAGSLSAGTLTATGLYTTPSPAPQTVTITATSTQDPTKQGSAIVALNPPAAATGPALTVDAGNQTHPINPFIYGMNAFSLASTVGQAAGITVDRFGGDATSRYNYQLDVTSAGSDWWYENSVGATGQQETSQFNQQVIADAAIGAKTLGTVSVLGYVAANGKSCSFPSSIFPNQYAFMPYGDGCGDGEYPDQTNITGNDTTITSTPVGPAWAGGWVDYLVSKFGSAVNGGVAMYDLDNEPAWWDGNHRDVHPAPSTYDEVTNNGIATAEAIKTADPTAGVNGPIVDLWWNYFYSKADIESGWNTGYPCFKPFSNPIDRKAHGGVPFIEYYLQQFKAAETTFGARLLDYLDIHAYEAAKYNGADTGFAAAGDTGAQMARLNSTRAMWDATYTDPGLVQPNYTTDANYVAGCNTPLQAPQIIPLMHKWVNADYPGTKTAITEYNWGGQESMNGALAQADLLGIFGAYGLDLATLWGPPDPVKQVPGLVAFEVFRNYDGAGANFGETALASTSANQGQLAVYGAKRASDGSITIVILNKTYGDLTSTLSLPNLKATSAAKAFLYSPANLTGIVAQAPQAVTAPSVAGAASTISRVLPAQSITILVIPTV